MTRLVRCSMTPHPGRRRLPTKAFGGND